MSQYPDLLDAIDGLLRAFPLQERRTEAATWRRCPACGHEEVEYDNDTNPDEHLHTHEDGCPWLRAQGAGMYHEVRFVERSELVEAVEKLLARAPPLAPELAEWKNRTARAILDAIDVRVRHRPPPKPGA